MPRKVSQSLPDGRNRRAVEIALRAVSERIGDDLAPLVEACRSLADSVDSEPNVAALWKEYRGALADLRMVLTADEERPDEFAELIASLSA